MQVPSYQHNGKEIKHLVNYVHTVCNTGRNAFSRPYPISGSWQFGLLLTQAHWLAFHSLQCLTDDQGLSPKFSFQVRLICLYTILLKIAGIMEIPLFAIQFFSENLESTPVRNGLERVWQY